MNQTKKVTLYTIYGIKIYFVIASVVAIGLLLSIGVWKKTEDALKSRSVEQTSIIASAINKERIVSLTGTVADTLLPDYNRINRQLNTVRKNHLTCKYLYLLGQNEDSLVYFISDSQDKTSEDYLVPGFIYNEVSEEYLSVFQTGGTACVGPVTDRWGTFLTSLVPLFDDETGELLAVLGMDIEVDQWKRSILKEALTPLLLIIVGITVVFSVIIQRMSYLTMKKQYEENLKLTDDLLEAAAE